MPPKRSSAFTYIEMLAVLTITMLLAGIVMPNLVAERKNRNLREFKTSLRSLAANARTQAIESGDVVALHLDQGGKSMTAVEELSNGAQRQIDSVSIVSGVSAQKLRADRNESSQEDWRVPFFSDGMTAGGGIEFSESGQTLSFIVSPLSGAARWVDGPLPDLSLDQWKAGSYEKRL